MGPSVGIAELVIGMTFVDLALTGAPKACVQGGCGTCGGWWCGEGSAG